MTMYVHARISCRPRPQEVITRTTPARSFAPHQPIAARQASAISNALWRLYLRRLREHPQPAEVAVLAPAALRLFASHLVGWPRRSEAPLRAELRGPAPRAPLQL